MVSKLNLKKSTVFYFEGSATSRDKFKLAFTLAEVLITLGIIGVVAAMTIPTLIANTRSQQYRAQFKKTLSTLNQAGKIAQAQYGGSYGDTTQLYKLSSLCGDENPEVELTICSIFNGTLQGITYYGDNANVTQFFPFDVYNEPDIFGHYLDPGAPMFGLADGSVLYIEDQSFTFSERIFGFIDVNGFNRPNKAVQCSDGTDTMFINNANYTSCTVNSSDVTDIYPIAFVKDSSVIPATNAAAYVLNTAK